jgi:hypothetical protein
MSQTATKSLTLNIQGQLTITTASLPPAIEGQAYSVALQATGGVTPYTWSFLQGSDIPTGLSLDTATGVISGTPTVTGSFPLNVQVVDSGT